MLHVFYCWFLKSLYKLSFTSVLVALHGLIDNLLRSCQLKYSFSECLPQYTIVDLNSEITVIVLISQEKHDEGI